MTINVAKLKDRVLTRRNCKYSDYVNDFDQKFKFQCPGKKVLVGTESYHSNKQEDRRFRFECCDLVLVF